MAASRSRSKPRKGGGGIKGGVGNLLWLGVVASVAVALFGPAVNDPEGFYVGLKNRSERYAAQAKDFTENWKVPALPGGPGGAPAPGVVPGGAPKPGPGAPGAEAGRAELAGLATAPDQKVAYDRGQWRHWDNIRACWTVREQVLYRDAQPGSATLLDERKVPTKDVSQACYITGGTWIDPYTGEQFGAPEDLDIDHMVPLGNAARTGGQGWNGDKKKDYANDLTDPGHLLAVSASANRSKSDESPETWRPTNKGNWCTYAGQWTHVKATWGLTVTPGEKAGLEQMFATC